MRRNLYAIVFALFCLAGNQAFGQLNLFWEELGPNNMGNHTRALTVGANGTAWAGSVGGGLWKSTNDGATWEQVSGVDASLAVSTIAVDGDNIYVGTGETFFIEPSSAYIGSWKPDSTSTYKEGFHQYSGQPGQGVFVSNDGGNTWSHNNGTWNSNSVRYEGKWISIQKVVASNGRVLIATLDGLYWSNDANLSSVTKCTGNSVFESRAFVDVEFAANNVVLAATADSVYRSTNNGTSFAGKAINDSIFSGGTAPNNRVGGDRIEIAVAPSDQNIVYVTGASNINGNCTGVWRSADRGINWTRLAPFESATFQPFQGNGRYACVLEVNPLDADAILLGGAKLYGYDPGQGWDDAASHFYTPGFSTRYVPTPQLSLAFDPTADSTMFIGTDAEIVRSNNYTRTFSFKTKGFNNAHLYGISSGSDYSVVASDRYQGLLYKSSSSTNSLNQQFNDIYTATQTRTGVARILTTNPDFIVSQGNEGGLVRSFNKGEAFEQFYGVPLTPINASFGTNPDSIFVDRADSTSGSGGLYDIPTLPVNGWCLDEYIPAANLSNDTSILNTPIYLYLCSRHFVWVCTNPFGGVDSLPNWNRITPDLVTDFFGVGKKEFLTTVAVSGDADHTVYVGTNVGKIFRINNANDPANVDLVTSITRVDTLQTFNMPDRWISDIEFDHSNPDNLIITYGAYENSDDRVFITNNSKAASPTFRSIQGNLEANLPVYTAGFDPDPTRKGIIIGTDEGVRGTSSDYENASANIVWTNESAGIGKVAVTDVSFRLYYKNIIDPDNYSYGPDYRVFVATHGRGAFTSSSLVRREEPGLASSGIEIGIGPNPTADQSTISLKLPRATKVKLEAFDLNGTRVAVLRDRTYSAGNFEIEFDARDLPAGIYLIKGQFSNGQGIYNETLKQIVVK